VALEIEEMKSEYAAAVVAAMAAAKTTARNAGRNPRRASGAFFHRGLRK
jgi:hypothetical protein